MVVIKIESNNDLMACKICPVRDPCLLSLRDGKSKSPKLDKAKSILETFLSAKNSAKEIRDHVRSENAKGRSVAGFRVIERHGMRRFTHESIVAKILSSEGVDPYLLISVYEAERRLGKTRLIELLGDYIVEGPPSLSVCVVNENDNDRK